MPRITCLNSLVPVAGEGPYAGVAAARIASQPANTDTFAARFTIYAHMRRDDASRCLGRIGAAGLDQA
jgi:hypothetical protein